MRDNAQQSRIKLDTHLIASALSLYRLKMREDVKYWREAEADADKDDKSYCRTMQDDARLELAKVNELYDKLQNTDTACLADYEFFAERKDRY